MNFSKLLSSKTFWTGFGSIGYGVYQMIEGDSSGIQTILLGFGMIFGRNAIAKI